MQLRERHPEDGCGQSADRTDREIDLSHEQHQNHADGDRPHGGALQGEVYQVVGREEYRVECLEGRPDQNKADHDRQRAEIAPSYALAERAHGAHKPFVADQSLVLEVGGQSGAGFI